ncbi:uncharacterized protein LOC125656753 isoform X1 [Ostrea edulis]|uniref:uncharacterized protein LOC125656753 isoform X1 n=1 Tax=Ostrea edulis TaxID=37623 RepID=UPI002095E05F|nr:uncharacterized protein LOC125656753 isoform X1 [Ostrea edulis]
MRSPSGSLFLGVVLIFVTEAVRWPRGTYTLVKPRTGCPRGWHEGWRHQDNEDSNNKNYLIPRHHFAGSFGKDMRFHYCTKDPHKGSRKGNWPRGNYCILKHGMSCPKGFREGKVLWDDEDKRNSNRYGGTLPRGTYSQDTRIYYCCRNDGSFRKRIRLPTKTPFYLLRFRAPCQRVQGMYVREETVHFDDEDSRNKNAAHGWYPMGAGGRDHNLHYCFYRR